CPGHVRGAVGRLHARQNTERPEAGDVRVRQDLSVLHSVARVYPGDRGQASTRAARSSPEHRLERVEDERVGAVADRVDAYLEAPLRGHAGAPLELIRR